MTTPKALVILFCAALLSACGGQNLQDSALESTTITEGAPEVTTTTSSSTPTISSISPADGDTSVAVSKNITVTFSEAMDTSTITAPTSTTCSGSIQVSSDSFSTCVKMGTNIVAGTAKKIFTVSPSADLSGSTTYKVKVTTDAKSSAGVALASDTTQTTGFTTVSTSDTTAPTVSSVTPVSSVSATTTSVVVTFSEAMSTSSITADQYGTCTGTVYLQNTSSGSCITMSSTVTASSSDTVFTFTLSGSMSSGTSYKVVVGTAAKDTTGNALASAYSGTTFTTLTPWTTLASLSSAQTSINCIYLSSSGAQIWCSPGVGSDSSIGNTFKVYTISSDTWGTGGPTISGVDMAFMATSSSTFTFGPYCTTVYCGAITNNTYTGSVGSTTATASNTYLLTAAGAGLEYLSDYSMAIGFGGFSGANAEKWVYYSTGGAWTIITAHITTGRFWIAHAQVSNKIYLFGGATATSYITDSPVSTAQVITPDSGAPAASTTIASIASLSTATSQACAATYNSEIYIFGGKNSSSTALTTVLKYSPTSDAYTTKTSMGSGRFGLGCATDGTYIYLVGGQTGTGYTKAVTTVERYNPAND